MKNIWAFLIILSLLFLLSSCTPRYYEGDDSPRGLFSRGQQALKERRFNEAHYSYSELVKKYPKSDFADEALYKKGYLEVYLSKYADAQKSFSTLMKNYPGSKWRFDASLWDGLLGELSACKNAGKSSDEKNLSDKAKSVQDLQEQIEKMNAENIELRQQLKKLRELLQE